MNIPNKKILVTGGAGFIGSNLVEELLKRGETVRVIDNFSTGKRENLSLFLDKIELIEGDIRSYHIVREAVDGMDVILHQAALPSVPRSIRDPITSNEVNVIGTLNILDAAKEAKVKRVVFASSSSVYGDNAELPKHEAMVPNPLSPYAVSKLTGEKYCSVFSKIYGLETVALRYFNVFGPRQDPNSQYSAVIPRFITSIFNDKQPVVYGDGEQSRDFTFVENVVHANILAATGRGGIGIAMNCACHERITLNRLIADINAVLGKNIQPIYRESRAGDIKHSYASIKLAEEQIGYSPRVLFDAGLRKTIEWYTS
jgi:UDP-glucose 4-epimerase